MAEETVNMMNDAIAPRTFRLPLTQRQLRAFGGVIKKYDWRDDSK